MVRPLSRAEIRDVDRRAIQELGLPGIVLMENAGRGASEIIRKLHSERFGDASPGPIGIVCGPGNNGGDGFVIARWLANAGYQVECFLAADPTRLQGDALTNHHVATRMRLPIHPLVTEDELARHLPSIQAGPLIIDAMLGTGSTGAPRPPFDRIIRAVNAAHADRAALVVAIDLPSGLDCDTGEPADPTIRADHTITFVAPKLGFNRPAAMAYVGRVHVVDIGAPAMLWNQGRTNP